MSELYEIVTLLQVVIGAGAAARIVYCLVIMPMDEDEGTSYKKRIRNLLVFLVAAESVGGIMQIIIAYLGG